jgi:hypothetical protein
MMYETTQSAVHLLACASPSFAYVHDRVKTDFAVMTWGGDAEIKIVKCPQLRVSGSHLHNASTSTCTCFTVCVTVGTTFALFELAATVTVTVAACSSVRLIMVLCKPLDSNSIYSEHCHLPATTIVTAESDVRRLRHVC